MRNLTLALAVLVASAAPLGCTQKVSAEDCEKFGDHMVAMTQKATGGLAKPKPGGGGPADPNDKLDAIVKKMVQDQRATFVGQCNQGMPRKVFDCMMKYETIKEISAECARAY